MISEAVKAIVGGVATAALVFLVSAEASQAQQNASRFSRDTPSQQGRDKGQYIPTISITPDGCEAWVMDDGAEGYAVNHVNRDGIPYCREADLCGVMNSDQLFATDKYSINATGRKRLAEFFQQATAFGYIIVGHTDSRASDEYNMRLSYNRANAVAKIANDTGANVIDIRGYGERMPRASNSTAAGMQQNRRVEIICVQ